MLNLAPLNKVDYLVIGHISRDLTPEGHRLGGTAAYAALTARALGLRVGILTSFEPRDLSIDPLTEDIQVFITPTKETTTFENIETPTGRQQILHQQAAPIDFEHTPNIWRRTPIMHLAPVAQEIEAQLPKGFAATVLGMTPQGWLRGWDAEGNISPSKWSEMEASLNHTSAAVLSMEDVQGDEALIEEMSLASRILVVTEGSEGVRLYWNGDLRRFRAPKMDVIDTTGAGDIFAAAFFIRLYNTRDPWEAARFATSLAAYSVQRCGLESIPTQEEIQNCQMEVL
ncbi:MAG: ribokinase [Anaerolineae bacterium]|jgi:sugar/nucleoside kinase (ribokinase family)|nr:ribokinase [Anaerolineae bacterium]MBT7072294.1 ribokinase [Anaerolineae bacterium]MBT7326111.1 ribokinase [Anaerolineae bacterium]MBT7601776.1 ribokinase [Anaerolineae bacterium]